MKSLVSAVAVVLLSVWPGPVQSASIGLFSTPDCSSCNLTISANETKSFYISAQTEELFPDGILGAAFRVTELPVGWTWTFEATPSATFSFGDPLGEIGATVSFPGAMTGPCIELYRVSVTATSDEQDVTLRVTTATPSYPPCSWVAVECGGACDVVECVDGGELFVNSDKDCQVAVEKGTWGTIKELYRD